MSDNYRTVLELTITKHGEPLSEEDRDILFDVIRDHLDLNDERDSVDLTYEDDERIG